MDALDMSRLARSSDQGLRDALQHRRTMRRQAAEQYGRDSIQHRSWVRSIHTVVLALQDRGLNVPAYGVAK